MRIIVEYIDLSKLLAFILDRYARYNGISLPTGSIGIIRVENGASVTIVLDEVTSINAANIPVAVPRAFSPLQIESGAEVMLVLVDGTTNTFTCDSTDTGNEAINSAICVPVGASLTIKAQSEGPGAGKLHATAGAYSAAIGGNTNSLYGNITIEGGIIKAHTRKIAGTSTGAGIGGGGGNSSGSDFFEASVGVITICGSADVEASSWGRNSTGNPICI